MKEEIIRLEIKPSEVKELLSPAICGANKNILLEAIIDSSDEQRLALLFKAALGIRPELEYGTQDEVYVRLYPLTTWNWDKDRMKTHDLLLDINDNELISAKIIDVKPFSHKPYKIAYRMISKDYPEIVTEPNVVASVGQLTSEWVSGEYIKGPIESWPEF